MKRLKSADMGKYSGFGCGGVAGSLYELDNLDELRETIGYLKSRGRSYYILGKGYNTLIKEGKIHRDIITLKNDFTKISARGCF
ncbi:MAG: hypothetical protein PF545_07475, partial [Elusimicrobia bacterium]|nr:hypothetical protein [Elusimicrobiota bacterium]